MIFTSLSRREKDRTRARSHFPRSNFVYSRVTWEIIHNYSHASNGNDSPYFVRSPIIEEATHLLLDSSFLTLISQHMYSDEFNVFFLFSMTYRLFNLYVVVYFLQAC